MDLHRKLQLIPLGWIIEHLENMYEIILMPVILLEIQMRDTLNKSQSKIIAAAHA
tara:strand:+ start:126 stop:290 length:165 start_codon:yes stop_codon:yes gene_type:complete